MRAEAKASVMMVMMAAKAATAKAATAKATATAAAKAATAAKASASASSSGSRHIFVLSFLLLFLISDYKLRKAFSAFAVARLTAAIAKLIGAFARLRKGDDVFHRGFRYAVQRLLGQEGLMGGNDDIRH